MLHPVQDVARFLESLGGAALACAVLVSILLILRIAHIIGRLLKTLDGLLEAGIGYRSGAAAICTAAKLSGLLALLS